MHKYRLVAKKGEGTFSEVLKAQCIKNGKYVAIKCMKNHFDSLDQVNNLREIQALRRLSPHANIIKLLEVLYDQPTGRLALVFELMDMNIYELIRGRRHYVAEDRIKNYMYQLMKSMDHMHRNGIFHRDIKPENILIMDDCLKLADFGSCRGIYSKQPYTEYISTRWYRAPECLLTDGYYNYKMDMWGVGCVFFELVSLFPLFPGTNELDQITKIHNILGTPPAELLSKMKKRSQHMDFNFPTKEGSGIPKLIPHVNPECVELIVKLLMYNPDERLSARQALRHPYFKEQREAEKRQKALLTPDLNSHFHQMDDPARTQRQHAMSSNGSDHDGPVSPPDSMTHANDMNLPSIGKGLHSGVDKDDDSPMADSNGHRLPNLHAQNSMASMDGPEEGSLPPIGSLSKASMSNTTNTSRRTTQSYYAAESHSYPKKGAGPAVAVAAGSGHVGSSGAASVSSRRQSGAVPPGKYSNKQAHPTAQPAPLSNLHHTTSLHSTKEQSGSMSSGFKYNNKANKSNSNSKYISPYSLRQLAGQNAATG